MDIIDTHCDALLKLQQDDRKAYDDGEKAFNFYDSPEIETNVLRLREGGVKVQFFAIFIPPEVPDNEKWQHALEQVDCFYNEVLSQENFIHIKNLKEIEGLKPEEIGAVLTLEGADAVGNDLMKLRTLFRLGVLSVGLTWNNANLVADGVGENRDAGLSGYGERFVASCNAHGVLIDISHLCPKGVTEVLELGDRIIATHSNSRSVCDHRRNLTDDQIRRVIEKGGMINIVFNPPFIGEGKIKIEDVFSHIDKIINLGGEEAIGLGSDFDGITCHVERLGNAGEYGNLIDALKERYGETFTEKIAYGNFVEKYCKSDLL
ncbi:dipeptidase [Salinicoccus siamensis]|uniref:Dipeptidase n=1 Tax=Salinicoccus siamensis TaxID=381830 RepID=A0ABV5Z437_9STAP